MRALGLLAAYVAGYDTWAAFTGRPTISTDFLGAMRAHPVVVTSVTAYVVFHLYGVIPPSFDPLRAFGGLVAQKRPPR